MEDRIRQYWDSQALKYGCSHWASWGDIYMIKLEAEIIGGFIKPGAVVLDVGCANGFATLLQRDKGAARIVGLDFSSEMINCAKQAKMEAKSDPKLSDVEFLQGDVRNLEFDNHTFDYVYTTRVLINLPDWEQQKRGINECLRVCRPGGTVVFTEGFWEPLVLLNAMRALKGLPALEEHDFNRYLKMRRLEDFCQQNHLRYEVIDYSSVYYLGSRFLRELVTRHEEYPGYSNPINEIFYNIQRGYRGGGWGIQQACVISR